jgi:hypothetical protein
MAGRVGEPTEFGPIGTAPLTAGPVVFALLYGVLKNTLHNNMCDLEIISHSLDFRSDRRTEFTSTLPVIFRASEIR